MKEFGLVPLRQYDDGARFHRWTLDEVRSEVLAGRPVVPQVHYPDLPNHKDRQIDTDHYIVIVGLEGDAFVYNDPADRTAPGFRQQMTAAEFTYAWQRSNEPFAAFAVGPTAGRAVCSLNNR